MYEVCFQRFGVTSTVNGLIYDSREDADIARRALDRIVPGLNLIVRAIG